VRDRRKLSSTWHTTKPPFPFSVTHTRVPNHFDGILSTPDRVVRFQKRPFPGCVALLSIDAGALVRSAALARGGTTESQICTGVAAEVHAGLAAGLRQITVTGTRSRRTPFSVDAGTPLSVGRQSRPWRDLPAVKSDRRSIRQAYRRALSVVKLRST